MILTIATGALFLSSLIAAIVKPVKQTRMAVVVTAALFGAAWAFILIEPPTSTVARKTSAATVGSCASINVGESEAKVRERMGEPTETKGEDELRGPGANVWIYRHSRCAVHFLSGVVESID